MSAAAAPEAAGSGSPSGPSSSGRTPADPAARTLADPDRAAWLRTSALWAAVIAWIVHFWLTWTVIDDTWRFQPDVSAPLTRMALFYHPASAWTSFVAYFLVFAFSVAYLNERLLRYDRPARAAAGVGFAFNTMALLTGTFWGLQEWSRTGQNALATVYTEPKVLVVLVMWFAFAAYLLLRRLVDGPERRARLAAVFGILGFLGVPLSFATSRLLQTSLHPDVGGPGANPDAAVGPEIGMGLGWSLIAFLLLFLHLWLQRARLLALEERVEDLEEPW